MAQQIVLSPTEPSQVEYAVGSLQNPANVESRVKARLSYTLIASMLENGELTPEEAELLCSQTTT